MLTWIIGGGLGLLCGLAILIGHQCAHDRAWRAVARARREVSEMRRSLSALADDLAEESMRLHEWDAHLARASERALRRDEQLGGTER